MRLFFIVRNLVISNSRVVAGLIGLLRFICIQKPCCIVIDVFQILLFGVDALGTPDQCVSHIGRMFGKELIVQFNTQFCC